MNFFAHKTWGGFNITFYKIEVKEQEIWFRKIGTSLFFDYLSEVHLIGDLFSYLTYKFISEPMYRQRIQKVLTLQDTTSFLQKRGNFILSFEEIERIHYNSTVILDIYFILHNGKEYNFSARMEDLEKIKTIFSEIKLTTHDPSL